MNDLSSNLKSKLSKATTQIKMVKHVKKKVCDICKKEISKSYLKNHMLNIHKIPPNENFIESAENSKDSVQNAKKFEDSVETDYEKVQGKYRFGHFLIEKCTQLALSSRRQGNMVLRFIIFSLAFTC